MTFRDPSHSRNDFHLCLLLFSFFFFFFVSGSLFLVLWTSSFRFGCCISVCCCCCYCYCLPPPLHWVCWVQQCVVLSALRSETNEFRSGCYHSRHRCCATTASNGNLEDGDDIALYEPTIHQQPAETHFILLIQKLILISYRAYASSCSLSDWIICNQSRNDLDESFILLDTECNYW